jgi:hypothetical protein
MDASTKNLGERAVVPPSLASHGSPFLAATIGGVFLEERFNDLLVLGLEGGIFAADVVRIAVRLEMPSNNVNDQGYPHGGTGNGYFAVESAPPKLLYGAALGFAVANSSNFAFSPGLLLVRSDVSDYGTVVAAALPFEWVTSRGLRFGFEVDVGRSFGGDIKLQCTSGCSDARRTTDREAGRAFGLRFTIGYGFGYYKGR